LTVFAFQSNIKVIGSAYFYFPFSDEFIRITEASGAIAQRAAKDVKALSI